MLFNLKEEINSRSLAKSRLIIEAYRAMGYDGINIGEVDLRNGPGLLDQLPFVSANLRLKKAESQPFSPFLMKRVGSLRVAVFGLLDPSVELSPLPLIEDPTVAARRTVERLIPESDLIICLSSLSLDQNKALAQTVAGIDFLIGCRLETARSQPILSGSTLIFQAGIHGQYVGRIDITLQDLRRPYRFSDLHLRSILTQSLENVEKQIQDILSGDGQEGRWSLSELSEWREKLRGRLAPLRGENTFLHSLIPLDSTWKDDPAIRLSIDAFKTGHPSSPY